MTDDENLLARPWLWHDGKGLRCRPLTDSEMSALIELTDRFARLGVLQMPEEALLRLVVDITRSMERALVVTQRAARERSGYLPPEPMGGAQS